MKKEIPQGAIIGAIVLIALVVVVFAWKTLSEGAPPRENIPASALKPDPVPEGRDPSSVKAPPPTRTRSTGE